MTKPLKVKHSYNAGDLIASLPGLQHIWETQGRKTILYQELDFPAFYYEGAEHPVKGANGQQVSVNQKTFDMLWPLIISQPYIENFKVWEGQSVDINFMKPVDNSMTPIRYGSLFHWPFMAFPDLSCDLSKRWIHLQPQYESDFLRDKIIVNRTSRYTNPYINYYFLKEYEDRVFFIGTHDEWAAFNAKYNLNTSYLLHENFEQYARSISECQLFIGNQSFFFHLAHSMSKRLILEVCSEFPNCWPMNGNAVGFLYQNALEHLFKQKIKTPEWQE